jgi:hypothetical protein
MNEDEAVDRSFSQSRLAICPLYYRFSRKPEIAPKTFLFPTRTHFPPQKRHAKKTVDFSQADHITAIPCDLLVGSVCLSLEWKSVWVT